MTSAQGAPQEGGTLDPALPGLPGLQVLRAACVATLLALVALGLAWETWLAPTGRGALALKVLPLLLALPGLWRHRLYTYRWLSLLLWLYVLEGLVRSTTEQGLSALLAALEVALAVSLFTTAVAYIRRRLRAAAPAPAQRAA